ncbi:preprotein translocase subunit YajC [Saxibacter everestensis]|uniref:Preprotein translocase subunit YajC n=1 Tax=Saxibacter everestensis TaxID=2909229 RepID=A0ABY8QXS9_9MICO|nr:preprotein translocase subunit YajC [Brevibacteriaceae bacterium ZFBP1038]
MEILLVVVLGGLLIFMMYNSRRKQKAQQQEMATKLGPGAEVMTTFGVFGTVISVNEETNEVLLESGPSTTLRIHKQAIGKITEAASVHSTHDDAAVDEIDVQVPNDASGLSETEPEFGKRADTTNGVDARDNAVQDDVDVRDDLVVEGDVVESDDAAKTNRPVDGTVESPRNADSARDADSDSNDKK